jgi:hypothetical protein
VGTSSNQFEAISLVSQYYPGYYYCTSVPTLRLHVLPRGYSVSTTWILTFRLSTSPLTFSPGTFHHLARNTSALRLPSFLKPACNSTGVSSSQTPNNMAEFMFVNLNEPTQNKRREVRKLVRSHVSYMQHSQKRTELGQVQKPTKSRYTDRSVNGWAVLDDGRAGQRSQLKLKAASGLNSGLLAQHQSTLPGSDPIRSPRQLYNEEITAPTKSQHRPRQIQRQPKASTSPTPIPGDEVNAMKESPQTVSTLPIIKSEVYVTSPGGVIVKQEQEDQTDRKWDIVSQHSSGSQSLSSPFTSEWRWEGDESQSTSLPFFFSNLGDPTDELRNRIELSRMSMSSVMVSLLHFTHSIRNREKLIFHRSSPPTPRQSWARIVTECTLCPKDPWRSTCSPAARRTRQPAP